MSKFSVGQRIRTSEDFATRLNGAFGTRGLNLPITTLTGTVVGIERIGTIIRLDLVGHETVRAALEHKCWRDDGWCAHDGELTPLRRFSVNDKVTIKRTKAIGVVSGIDEVDAKRPYCVQVAFDGFNEYYFVSDDDLDPYVEPPAPERPSFDNDEIIAYITSRFEKGFETYGQGVKVDDPYDWPTMTLEELADACIYLTAQVLRLKRQEAKGA